MVERFEETMSNDRGELRRRIAWLAARSARRRDRLADALATWRVRADRVDRTVLQVRRRAGWLSFLGGAAIGLAAAARPRLIAASVRAAAATWLFWLRARSR